MRKRFHQVHASASELDNGGFQTKYYRMHRPHACTTVCTTQSSMQAECEHSRQAGAAKSIQNQRAAGSTARAASVKIFPCELLQAHRFCTPRRHIRAFSGYPNAAMGNHFVNCAATPVHVHEFASKEISTNPCSQARRHIGGTPRWLSRHSLDHAGLCL